MLNVNQRRKVSPVALVMAKCVVNRRLLFCGVLTLIYLLLTAMQYKGFSYSNKRNQKENQGQDEVKEELRNKNQIQLSHGTSMNRYPEQYNFLKELVAQNQTDADKKILSFGCATGEETLTLAQHYFLEPSIKVFGVDVADFAVSEASAKAKLAPEGKITILDGRKVSPKDHGPFDVVLGNSVFCIYGIRGVPYKDINYVMKTFPFSVFESMLDEIDSYLKVGGVLSVFNSNYDFMDTHLAERYEPIVGKKCPNHFVPRIDRENKKFVYLKDAMMDCLFRKVKSKTDLAPMANRD